MKTNKKKDKTKIKFEWHLGLFYKSENDPALEQDVLASEVAVNSFEQKYSKNQFWQTASQLKQAIDEYEAVIFHPGRNKPILYFYYRKAKNTADEIAEANINKLTQRLTNSGNKLLFFEITLSKLDSAKQKELLLKPELQTVRYFLKKVFEEGKHTLSILEEKIMNLKSLPSYDLWVQSFEKFLNSESVVFKGKKLPLAEAEGKISSLNKSDRRSLQQVINKRYKQTAAFAEAELNAIIINKKINDQLRHYAHPYEETVRAYQNEPTTVLSLSKTVTANFEVSHRFYKVKARLMKQKRLLYADRSAPIGAIKTRLSFESAVDLVGSSFGLASEKFETIFRNLLSGGQVDVYPQQGKEGGAFCSSSQGAPTMVMLNHVDNVRSLMTLAHEMGHAIHAQFSKQNRPLFEGVSISTAETASTFFEYVVFNNWVETLSAKEQMIALHDRLNDDMSTIFRQISFFNFEIELHEMVAVKGFVSHAEIAQLLNKHTSQYLGPAFDIKPDDGYFFVTVSHFRRFFYVYAYAFGQLISRVLYERYKKDKKYIQKIVQFLEAGGSKSPEDIFAEIGIDCRNPSFWQEGINSLKKDIDRFERLSLQYKL